MSNILIIKHGSLGDLIQAQGAIQDIKETYQNSKILLLTAEHYSYLMSQCPYIDGVLVDKRLPRWNVLYLLRLKRLLKKYNFTHVFDLQNSKRTKFYKNFLLKKCVWSSTDTTLEPGQNKKDFNKEPVLKRMKAQLTKSKIKTLHIYKPDLAWSFVNISRLIKQYANNEYILIYPFCSKKHEKKKWPFFKELIIKIKKHYKNRYPILIAPGPNEINACNDLNAKVVLENNNPIDLNQLITLINNSKFVISNDTGPAHICSHLNKKGLVLFGNHTSSKKVSIKTKNLNILETKDLKDLSVDIVFKKTKEFLD